MFEETNQTVETSETQETSFGDAFSEPEETTLAEEMLQSVPAEPGAPQNQPAEQPPDERYTVTYNGQPVELTREQLLQNAQKGLNYDHIKQQRDELKNSRIFSVIDRFARESGMTREAYVDFLDRQAQQVQIAQQAQEQGIPEPVARELFELKRKEREREERENMMQREAQKKQGYLDFIREYPDVRTIPEEVMRDIAAGARPVDAYRAYENRQLKAKLQTFTQNEQNAKNSPGSMRGEVPPPDGDDFLAGFTAALRG